MFLKEVYQRRIRQEKQQESTHRKKIKNRSPQIGSIKHQRINFANQQSFFAYDDIPNHAKQAKNAMKYLVDPDYLQLKNKQWNSSVSVPKKFQLEKSHQQRLMNIKIGMYDAQPIKYKQTKIYPGTQLRDDYTNWNVSTYVGKKQINQGLLKTNLSAFNNSELFSQRRLKNYLKPIQKYYQNQKYRKQEQNNDQSLCQTIRQEYKKDNPYASPQKTNAIVFKQLERTKRKQLKQFKQLNQGSTQDTFHSNFKASLSPTQKLKIKIQYYHTGIWQKYGKQQEQCWSCCMNQDYQNPGCVKKVVDGNKLNFSSYTHD